MKTDEIKISDNEKVEKLKSLYLEVNKLNPEKIKLRFLFGGNELKDEEEIYKYKLKNNSTIQLNKREI
jgi:hypothetical protein